MSILRESTYPFLRYVRVLVACAAPFCIPQQCSAQIIKNDRPAVTIQESNLFFSDGGKVGKEGWDLRSFGDVPTTRGDQRSASTISRDAHLNFIPARFRAHREISSEFGVSWQHPNLWWRSETADAQQTGSATDKPALQPQDPRDRIFYPGDTERLKPLTRKLLLNILLDEKEIFTSPFHMNRRNAKWWLLAAGATAGLIAADHHIADAFENSRGQIRWGGRISQIGASYTLVPLVAGYYGYGVWKDHAKAREIGVLGTESLLDSLITVEVLKAITRRNRPDDNNPGDFWGGGTSFPSGHAIQMWSIASLVAHEYQHQPVVSVVAYGLAATVSAARIAAQKHFASDVFVGGTMGWFIGRYVYGTHMSHLAHTHSSLIPMIVPQFGLGQRTYGVMVLLGGTVPNLGFAGASGLRRVYP
jgi:membrane-associated phospholipid phosphatase